MTTLQSWLKVHTFRAARASTSGYPEWGLAGPGLSLAVSSRRFKCGRILYVFHDACLRDLFVEANRETAHAQTEDDYATAPTSWRDDMPADKLAVPGDLEAAIAAMRGEQERYSSLVRDCETAFLSPFLEALHHQDQTRMSQHLGAARLAGDLVTSIAIVQREMAAAAKGRGLVLKRKLALQMQVEEVSAWQCMTLLTAWRNARRIESLESCLSAFINPMLTEQHLAGASRADMEALIDQCRVSPWIYAGLNDRLYFGDLAKPPQPQDS